MKRGKPPERRTPLKRGKKPAGRRPGPGLTKGRDLARTPIKPRRDAVRRKIRDEETEHDQDWGDVRYVIYLRAGGRCEVCGTQVNIHNMQAHHRRTRKLGPDCPCNALALCASCHHDEVHGKPEAARDAGRIVSRHFLGQPAKVPVEIVGRGAVLLACDGMYADAA